MAKRTASVKPAPETVAPKPAESTGLRLLYVRWGVRHLCLIDDCIRRLSEVANANMAGSVDALRSARRKLITENPSYREADELLRELIDGGFVVQHRDLVDEDARPEMGSTDPREAE